MQTISFFLFSGNNICSFVYPSIHPFKEYLLSNVFSHTYRNNVNMFLPLLEKGPMLGDTEVGCVQRTESSFEDSYNTRCWLSVAVLKEKLLPYTGDILSQFQEVLNPTYYWRQG